MLLGCMAQKYSCFDPYWSCFGSGCDLGRNQHGPTAVKTLPRPYPALCQWGRGAAYSAMAGQQECSLQSLPFSGFLQPFPSFVVLALHWKLAITWAIFVSESLYTLGSNVLCLCMFCRKQFRGKKKKKKGSTFLQIKARWVPSETVVAAGPFLLLPLSSWEAWQKGKLLLPTCFQTPAYGLYFFSIGAHLQVAEWTLVLKGRGRLEMIEQLPCLPAKFCMAASLTWRWE